MSIWEVVLEGKQGVNDMLNVFHYDDGGAGTPDFADIASAFFTAISTNLVTYAMPYVTWSGVTYREDVEGSVGVFQPFQTGSIEGGATDQSNITQLSMLMHKRTESLIRPSLGWFFQGGISAEYVDGVSSWDSAAKAAVEAYGEDIRVITLTTLATVNMVIKARNPDAPNTQAYTAVTSITADPTPRVLKGRRKLVGS